MSQAIYAMALLCFAIAQPAGIFDPSTDARKKRAQSTVTFRTEPSFYEAPTEPSTSEPPGGGFHQKLILACAQLSLGVLALHLQSMLLLAPPTDHWCKRPPEFANESAQDWKNAAIPLGPDGRHSQCAVYRFPYVREQGASTPAGGGPAWPFSGPEELPCREWEFDLPDGVSTVVSEWSLVCGHAWRLRVLRTFTHLGSLVCAPFVGTAADRLGRRPLILACAVAALAGAAQTVYAPDFFHFVVSRMVVAAALAGCSLVSLVLLFEVTSEASRSRYVCAALLGAALGSWLPCLLEGLTADRRTLAIAFLGVAFLHLFSFVGIHESARWLLAISDVVASEKYGPSTRLSVYFDAEVYRLRRQRAARTLAKVGPRSDTAASITSLGLLVVPTFWARLVVLSTVFLSQLAVLRGLHSCGHRESSAALPAWHTTALLVPRLMGLCISSWLLDRWDRTRALGLGIAIACATLTVMFFAKAHTFDIGAIALSELLHVSLLTNAAVACVYSLELYPTYHRATGVGSTFALTNFVTSLLPLMDNYDLAVRQMFAMSLAIAALVFLNYLPETKDAKLPETAFGVPSRISRRYSLSNASRATISTLDAGCRQQNEPSED
ncbi:hypothetical protein HPB48_021051 [Haemaphysalis longicornis]|uniref:Major facilitator superfamily (MFS) profile domain-containing protein n=1 Tax=Haemaphysalis longicornis TaxID=44386 RepID=A0A9J6FP49_HAELO|nr:hypothetical protein HPB48_021051 [Haemaphysalis longicornis]